MDEKLGRRHPTLRRLRALRRDAKLRREQGVFVAEGVHLVEEAVSCRGDIELVLYSERLAADPTGRALLRRLDDRRLAAAEVTASVLDSIQDARSPQPVLALVRRGPAITLDDCLADAGPAPLVAVAHGIQDPGNLGSLLRTADAAGATAFVVTGDGADLYHPRTVRGTMGSIFRLPAIASDLTLALAAFRRAGLATVATVPAAAPSSTDHRRAELGHGCALFFGGEGAGLPRVVLDDFDERVSIPTREGVESLSVGAAAAVILFEAARQRAANS